jgi:hypothetical protein
LCSLDFIARDWARPFRALDQRLLLDPEIKDLITELGILPIPVERAPHCLIYAKYPGME